MYQMTAVLVLQLSIIEIKENNCHGQGVHEQMQRECLVEIKSQRVELDPFEPDQTASQLGLACWVLRRWQAHGDHT